MVAHLLTQVTVCFCFGASMYKPQYTCTYPLSTNHNIHVHVHVHVHTILLRPYITPFMGIHFQHYYYNNVIVF